MLSLVISLFLGIFAGTLTGLIPGIHINLIAATFLFLIPIFPEISSMTMITFIVSMAITHTFLDFIPSIFLGAPDSDTALGILPGHKFLIKGLGHYAVILTLIGSTISIGILILIIPIFIFLIPKIYPFIYKMMAFFLIWISIFLIIKEKNSKIISLIIFLLAGFLGIASLNLPITEPLLPLLTGLFGSSTLIYSIKSKILLPKQIIEKIKIQKKELIKPALITILVSPICSFFPGIGSSKAAIIGSQLTKKLSREQFLILLGSINTLVMSISFLTLFLIQKSRTGAANAISQITTLTTQNLLEIILIIIITSIISIPLTIFFSKLFAKNIHKISYTTISLVILLILTLIILLFSGILGLVVFSISTILGLTSIEFGVKRSFLMGCLLIPTILFYLPF